MIGRGDKLEDLYVLHMDNLDVAHVTESFSAHVSSISTQTWHNRLEELSYKQLDFLQS